MRERRLHGKAVRGRTDTHARFEVWHDAPNGGGKTASEFGSRAARHNGLKLSHERVEVVVAVVNHPLVPARSQRHLNLVLLFTATLPPVSHKQTVAPATQPRTGTHGTYYMGFARA